MFGVRASELLKEVAKPDTLPVYNDEAVRSILEETRALRDEIARTLREAPATGIADAGVHSGLVIHNASVQRNQRVLLAYHAKLSPSEKMYFEAYSTALTAYMEGVDVDLAKDLAPPKSTHVLVRALRDCGEVLTADGRSVELKLGATIKMFAVDAEPLIRKGDLCHVDEKS